MTIVMTETQQLIQRTLRGAFERELEPLVPELEAGRLLPYDPMRRIVARLGLGSGGGELIDAMRDADPADALDRFVPLQLMIELSRVNAGVALSYGASLGLAGGAIMSRGTPEQKARWAVPVLTMQKIGAWGLTEPEAGSAALRDMRTTARRDGDGFVLNGSKTFITNAPYADVFVVYARLQDEEGESVQAFVVERGDPGLATGKPFHKMGMRSSPTGEIFLSDCRVPADRLLGAGIRQRDHVRQSLATERSGLQALSYGLLERAFDIAMAYVRERKQGGRPIGEYQLVQRRIARMYMALANARAFVYGDVIAKGRLPSSVADVCVGKLYVAEAATFVATEALHLLAGNGYMEEYVVERLLRDAKLIELGGGTTEIQELTAARWLYDHHGK